MRIVHHFNPTCLITVSLLVDDAKPAAKVKTARKPAPKVDEASDDQLVEANGSEGELLSLLLLFFVYHGNPINMRIVHHFNPTCLITVSLLVDDAKPAAKVKTAHKPAPKVKVARSAQSQSTLAAKVAKSVPANESSASAPPSGKAKSSPELDALEVSSPEPVVAVPPPAKAKPSEVAVQLTEEQPSAPPSVKAKPSPEPDAVEVPSPEPVVAVPPPAKAKPSEFAVQLTEELPSAPPSVKAKSSPEPDALKVPSPEQVVAVPSPADAKQSPEPQLPSVPPAAEAMPSSKPETEVELLEPLPDESVVAVAATKKRKEPTNDGLTVELRPRTRRQKKDKAVTPAKKDNVEFLKVDENMPTENEDSHLHKFPTGSSGKDRLLSVLKSDFTQPGSLFTKKTALYVDVENRDRWLTYKDFVRCKEKEYISSNVVNAYFWLLDQKFEDMKFGDSFVYSAMEDKFFEDDKLKRQLLAKWPESIDALFLPINIDDIHWILAVVNKRVKTIDVYDSLRYKNGKEIKLLIKKLDMVLDNNSVWKVNNGYNENIQRQLDSHSCAFFTCWYAYQLATGGSLEAWSADIDWKSRVEKIKECVYISLVDRKVAVIKKF